VATLCRKTRSSQISWREFGRHGHGADTAFATVADLKSVATSLATSTRSSASNASRKPANLLGSDVRNSIYGG
jgi:hypothetical protein